METKKFIAYYRVSTDKQGRGDLIQSFTEIESGRKNDRPELLIALDECRKNKAALVIAKLGRLARNVYFISGLV